MIELNDERRYTPLASENYFSIRITNGYLSLSRHYGKVLGYRVNFVTIDRYRYKLLSYDVSLDLAGNYFDRFLSDDEKIIVPVEYINGAYKNRNDKNNVTEIRDSKSLSKMLNMMM